MLKLTIGETELFNEADSTFTSIDGIVIELEHSLVSLSKWESKYQKPFLAKNEKTTEQVLDYIHMMILTTNAPEDILEKFTEKNLADVDTYIESKESATTFGMLPEHKGRGETITSELVYYWLVAYNIPFEVETWHLNRLFSLIRICNVKNSKPKKMSKSARAAQMREVNAQRRALLGTTG